MRGHRAEMEEKERGGGGREGGDGGGNVAATSGDTFTHCVQTETRVSSLSNCSNEDESSSDGESGLPSPPLQELEDLHVQSLSHHPHQDCHTHATPPRDETHSPFSSAQSPSNFLHGNQAAMRHLVKQSVARKHRPARRRGKPGKRGGVAPGPGGRKSKACSRTAILQSLDSGIW